MLNVYKIINDAETTFHYTYDKIMFEMPYNVLMMKLFTYYDSLKPKKQKKTENKDTYNLF